MMELTVNVRISFDETATALITRLIETLAQTPVAPIAPVVVAQPTPVEPPTNPVEAPIPLVEEAPIPPTPPVAKKPRAGVQKRQTVEQPKVVEQTPEEVIASTEVTMTAEEPIAVHTIEEIRVLATNLKQKGYGEKVRELLKGAGYNQLTDVPASDMDGCFEALQGLTTELLGATNG